MWGLPALTLAQPPAGKSSKGKKPALALRGGGPLVAAEGFFPIPLVVPYPINAKEKSAVTHSLPFTVPLPVQK